MQEGKLALYFDKIKNSKVRCHLCPHNCVIKPDGVGACRVRKNIDGELYSLNYGKVTSIALDPIEKKPLFRFHPGSMILSAGSFGCNLKCSFCQNWSIAHGSEASNYTVDVKPGELVNKAMETRNRGNIGIAYTYNEPSIWFEYVYDTARLAKKEGLVNVLVTNGFISIEPLMDLLPFIDAVNIDVKAFTPSFYSKICGAVFENVKETVEICAKKCHVEITTLVIPDLNDSLEEIEELSRWLSSISPEIPLHLPRFFPNYRMTDKLPTPVETLKKARDKALGWLRFVYMGNVR
jgi:pyruvate formate lyase activating enzyme